MPNLQVGALLPRLADRNFRGEFSLEDSNNVVFQNSPLFSLFRVKNAQTDAQLLQISNLFAQRIATEANGAQANQAEIDILNRNVQALEKNTLGRLSNASKEVILTPNGVQSSVYEAAQRLFLHANLAVIRIDNTKQKSVKKGSNGLKDRLVRIATFGILNSIALRTIASRFLRGIGIASSSFEEGGYGKGLIDFISGENGVLGSNSTLFNNSTGILPNAAGTAGDALGLALSSGFEIFKYTEGPAIVGHYVRKFSPELANDLYANITPKFVQNYLTRFTTSETWEKVLNKADDFCYELFN